MASIVSFNLYLIMMRSVHDAGDADDDGQRAGSPSASITSTSVSTIRIHSIG